jgi:DNA (cytosine-5)-methyltransferase 1
MRNKNIKILSLFSGGGFLDIGFINQGFSISESIEINPHYVKAYNYALTKYIELTICKPQSNNIGQFTEIVTSVDLNNKEEQARIGHDHFKISGIIGGPPCQDFAQGGKNVGITGERGKLLYSYLSIVTKVQPSFIFIENVSGLVTTAKHKIEFDKFLNKIRKAGYELWWDVLNTLNYGFPQDRNRLVIVGFKQEIVKKLQKSGYILEHNNELLKSSDSDSFIFKWPTIKYKDPKKMNWPKKNKFKKNGLKKDSILKNGCVEELCVSYAFRNLNNSSPNQDEHFRPKSDKFSFIEEGDTNRKSFKRLHRYRYSPTVAYGNNEVHLHPTKARRLTVREALRLQTVPDEYILPKDLPLTHKFKIISNGVPTKKAELIAKEIKRTLNLYYEL